MNDQHNQDLVDLYEPIATLKPVDENIWIVDGPIVRMAMYGTSIPFPTRMTIVRLNNGDLWCHSPIELTQKLPKCYTNSCRLDRKF
ncbi:hypothetical protein ACE1B6_23620 [Aerosakkonemataceae cyanobacterium BLCC-F154]|uniref:Uncharacterized protein n=1 Tax=Floridaenema fluviatile BLCC-F154 TaxID=3153640 RepID=A0ABV4YHK4_9CYAN